MTIVEELNDQIRRANSKVEEHLEAEAAALTTTSNVAISLATALAAGLAIFAKDALTNGMGRTATVSLVMAAVLTVLSLFLGVCVFVSRSGISHRAVRMWSASKDHVVAILAAGNGDEGLTQQAYADAAVEMARTLESEARKYQAAFGRTANLMTIQVSLLSTAVLSALISALLTYLPSA